MLKGFKDMKRRRRRKKNWITKIYNPNHNQKEKDRFSYSWKEKLPFIILDTIGYKLTL